MTEHLNSFSTRVSQLLSIDIKMDKEDKFLTLLSSLPNSQDNLIVAIGNTIKSTLNFEDVVAYLLLEEMRRKSMEGVANDVLSVRGHT